MGTAKINAVATKKKPCHGPTSHPGRSKNTTSRIIPQKLYISALQMGHDCKISNGITSASLRKQPTFFAPSPSGDSRDRRRTAVFAGYTSTQHGRIPLLRGTFTLMAPSGEMAMVWKLNMLSTATVLSFLVKIKTVTGKTSNSPRASSARCMV